MLRRFFQAFIEEGDRGMCGWGEWRGVEKGGDSGEGLMIETEITYKLRGCTHYIQNIIFEF